MSGEPSGSQGSGTEAVRARSGDLSEGRLAAIVDSSYDAILTKDVEGIIRSWNPGAERLYGYRADEAIGRPISILIPPHRSGEEHEILRRVLGGERVEHYETDRVTKDGRPVVVSLSISPLREADGTITGASVIARDVTAARQAAERIAALQRVTAALAAELDSQRVVDVLLGDVLQALGADAGTVGLIDQARERIRLGGSAGYSDHGLADWQEFPLAADVPMSVAVREAKPLWCSTAEELVARFPALASTDVRFEALAVVPLGGKERIFGVLALSFLQARDFDAGDRGFVLAAAQQAAAALERGRLYENERRDRERSTFLARAGELLSESLDVDRTLERLAFLIVPEIADWCGVDLVEDGAIRNVAAAHADPAKVELAHEIRRRYPQDPDAPTGVPNVVRTGRPELYPHVDEEMLDRSARDEEHRRLLRELGLVSALVVPLRARGRTLGAITLVTSESGRAYGENDLAFAEDLARRAGLAVDNAMLYREEHRAAVTLQRALLPRSLPELPGLQLAARYLPAGAGLEVGGDWYDVTEIGGDRVALVVGDVAGRGIRAASVMGQMRTGLRAYLLEDQAPDRAITGLARLTEGFEGTEMATVIHVVLDVREGTVEYVRAGHPPALVRAPDGSVSRLEGAGSPPLGVMQARHHSARAQLEPGSLLLLYTDGLIERRDVPIDTALDRLSDALTRAPEEPAECLDFILQALDATHGEDDIALLAARLSGTEGQRFHRVYTARAGSLSRLRRALESWLTDRGISREEVYDIVSACSEAGANATEHAYGPGEEGAFEVEAMAEDGDVTVTVRDRGSWRDPRGEGRGRGLKLIEMIMDEVEVERDDSGTRVRMQRRLGEEEEERAA